MKVVDVSFFFLDWLWPIHSKVPWLILLVGETIGQGPNFVGKGNEWNLSVRSTEKDQGVWRRVVNHVKPQCMWTHATGKWNRVQKVITWFGMKYKRSTCAVQMLCRELGAMPQPTPTISQKREREEQNSLHLLAGIPSDRSVGEKDTDISQRSITSRPC